jgi:predicted TIM-barrel fold metal-dependent hydrolase
VSSTLDAHDDLAARVDTLDLTDHHCHGVARDDLDREGFEALLSEGGPPPDGVTNFDTPVGIAVRRHCAPVLDLPAHAPPEEYVARRAELGGREVTRRLLSAAGTGDFCVDTGFRPEGLLGPGELAAAGGGTGYEIVRLEALAESVAAAGVEGGEFAAAFGIALEGALAQPGAVGVKSVAAYRIGFDFDPRPPSREDVAAAAGSWLDRGASPDGRWRLEDPVLVRHLLWTAVEQGRPIQLHVGFGDSDIRMHRVDPALLTDWLHAHRVPVMLLHCWPHHRTASYLAAIYPHVYLDLGLVLHYVGPSRSAELLAEAAETAPFGKLLYSSDAFGLAEFYYLGSVAFRRAVAQVLGAAVQAGEWTLDDAVRYAVMIAAGNARRVYRLEEQPAGVGTR